MRSEADRLEETLRAVYAAFNARDLGAVTEMLHADVDWPNAWEGGRVHGRTATADYWHRQFEAISSRVEPEGFEHEPSGEVTVVVKQTVDDTRTGERLSEATVRHRYRFVDGLIVRMDVVEEPATES